MYEDGAGTRLTLYARPGGERSGIRYARDGDVAAFAWAGGGLSYAVTAQISEARLLTIAQTIDAQTRGEPHP